MGKKNDMLMSSTPSRARRRASLTVCRRSSRVSCGKPRTKNAVTFNPARTEARTDSRSAGVIIFFLMRCSRSLGAALGRKGDVPSTGLPEQRGHLVVDRFAPRAGRELPHDLELSSDQLPADGHGAVLADDRGQILGRKIGGAVA